MINNILIYHTAAVFLVNNSYPLINEGAETPRHFTNNGIGYVQVYIIYCDDLWLM
jgi:hypothetical protein